MSLAVSCPCAQSRATGVLCRGSKCSVGSKRTARVLDVDLLQVCCVFTCCHTCSALPCRPRQDVVDLSLKAALVAAKPSATRSEKPLPATVELIKARLRMRRLPCCHHSHIFVARSTMLCCPLQMAALGLLVRKTWMVLEARLSVGPYRHSAFQHDGLCALGLEDRTAHYCQVHRYAWLTWGTSRGSPIT